MSLTELIKQFEKYPQFLRVRNGAPINSRGLPTNPHARKDWLRTDEAVIVANDHQICFVLTKEDPFFILDLDECKDASGKWNGTAIDICNKFSGCAIEVSQRSQGLHIIGSLPEGEFPHSCVNKKYGGELYTEGKTVTLTGDGLRGSVHFDASKAFRTLAETHFKPRPRIAPSDSTMTGPVPEWDGHADDDTLLSAALKSKSIKNSLGVTASFKDLWDAEEAKLSLLFSGRLGGFDHSVADMALCAHLAFWTGKDPERIDRLFRLSGLYREKWEREDYRNSTVGFSISGCSSVHKKKKKRDTERKDPVKNRFPFYSTEAQIQLFEGCTYVRDLHRVAVPDGKLLKPEQFRVMYGGKIFSMDADATKITKNAWEAFTESQAYAFPKVCGTCFRPDMKPHCVVRKEGVTLLNTYVEIHTERKKGDPAPFLSHLRLLFRNGEDRTIVLSYMAAMLQHPGVKFQWAPLIQGCEGNGKTFFIRAMEHCIGERYTHLPNSAELCGRFNGWLSGIMFMGIEEVFTGYKKDVAEALKVLITNSRIEIQGKGQDQVTGDNRANPIICSNHKSAVMKTSTDRRYCILFTNQQSIEDMRTSGFVNTPYFPDLYRWAQKDGYPIINEYLRSYDIPDAYNPATDCHRAPVTVSTQEAINESLGPAEQSIIESIRESAVGFRKGWVSSYAINSLDIVRKISYNKRKDIMTRLGCVPHPNLIQGRSTTEISWEGGKKPVIYIEKTSPKVLLPREEVVRVYCEDQGYS